MNSLFEDQMDRLYGEDTEQTLFVVKRFNIRSFTKRVVLYEPHIKKGQDIFNVMVFRNPENIDEGLYVAGRDAQVLAYHVYLQSIIKRVEADSGRYAQKPKPLIWQHIHKSQLNSNYASKRATKILYMVFDMLEYRNKILTLEKAGKLTMDWILLREFIVQIPILQNKKRYYSKVNYIDKSNNEEAI